MFRKNGLKINVAISVLVLFVALTVTLTNWYLSNKALETTLTNNYLENNYQYAQKISDSTSVLIEDIMMNLEVLATIIGQGEFTQQDLDYWLAANDGYFNSLFTTDHEGVVQLMSPQILPGNNTSVQPGTKIETDLMKEALQNKEPFISNPYSAQSGNLVVLVSFPIFNELDEYLGVVDGTIYLESDNSLERILHSHESLHDTSFFVVDGTGCIIYHPDSTRIKECIIDHSLIQNVIQGGKGAAPTTNNRGEEYLSGYAPVENTGWGIVAQTPSSIINEPLLNLTRRVIVQSLPLFIAINALGWILANHLSKPLNQLARYSEKSIIKQANQPIEQLKIKTNIYEINQLYKHVKEHFQLLSHQVQQDGLTGLCNRRTFDRDIKAYAKHQTPFSLLMIDIDLFKQVNDEFGHLVGDDVIRYFALTMQDFTRKEDTCYRYGGEEFAILLKHKTIQDAYQLAERLRKKVEKTNCSIGRPITISIGISASKKEDKTPDDIIDRADAALYESKQNGRNRTTIHI